MINMHMPDFIQLWMNDTLIFFKTDAKVRKHLQVRQCTDYSKYLSRLVLPGKFTKDLIS